MKDYLIELAKNIDAGLNVVFWTLWVIMVLVCYSSASKGELESMRLTRIFAITIGIAFVAMMLWPSAKFWDKF